MNATKDIAETNSITKYLDAFDAKMRLGMSAIVEAATIYVDALLHYSFAQRKFEERFPDIKKDSWNRLRDVGQHKLIPEAFLFRPYVAEKFRALPIKVQKQIQKSTRVQMATPAGKSITVGIAELSDRQVDILIDDKKGIVRSIEDQQKEIMKHAKPAVKRSSKAAWKVDKRRGLLEVNVKCCISVLELKNILHELTGE